MRTELSLECGATLEFDSDNDPFQITFRGAEYKAIGISEHFTDSEAIEECNIFAKDGTVLIHNGDIRSIIKELRKHLAEIEAQKARRRWKSNAI